jgi:predicted RNase H-like HicB family nuclease
MRYAERMSTVEYEGVAEARAGFKDLLDAASEGKPVGVRRDQGRFLVVDAGRMRHFLASVGPRPQIVAENNGWSLFFPGLPIASDGDTVQEAIDGAIEALRDYVEDWIDRLHLAPNHRDNWGLVQLVALSTDEQLQEWLLGFAFPSAPAR